MTAGLTTQIYLSLRSALAVVRVQRAMTFPRSSPRTPLRGVLAKILSRRRGGRTPSATGRHRIPPVRARYPRRPERCSSGSRKAVGFLRGTSVPPLTRLRIQGPIGCRRRAVGLLDRICHISPLCSRRSTSCTVAVRIRPRRDGALPPVWSNGVITRHSTSLPDKRAIVETGTFVATSS